VKNLLSTNLNNFKPYNPESGPDSNLNLKNETLVRMNANESPYPVPKPVLDQAFKSIQSTPVNFYPDTNSTELRRAIGEYLHFPMEQILVGNGSDEMIDVLIKTFVAAGDAVVSHDPTFSMYQIFTEIIGGKYYGIASATDDDFAINVKGLIEAANKVRAKAVFLCTPNNPTGLTISKEEVLRVLKETEAMVVIDEAYREFSDQDFLSLLNASHPRLIILRTFSKAHGLAGVRGGYLLGSPEAVSYLQQVKPPYNLNVLTQKILTAYLAYMQTPEGTALIKERIGEIRCQRNLLYSALRRLPGCSPYSGAGNFISFSVRNSQDRKNSGTAFHRIAETLDQQLLKEGFQIKKFIYKAVPYYRISMGKPEENQKIIEKLQNIFDD